MATGFRAVNTSNITQIDETYKNLAVIAEGSGTTGTTVTFPTQPFKPLIAIGVTGVNKYVRLAGVNYSNFTLVQAYPYPQSSGAEFAFTYKVFASVPNTLIQNPYGLEVRDASNSLIFNSNYKYFQLRYIQDILYSNFLNILTSGGVSNNPLYTLNTGLTGAPFMVVNGLANTPIYQAQQNPSGYGYDYDASTPYALSFAVHPRMMISMDSASVIKFGWQYNTVGTRNYSNFESKFKLILGY